MHTFAPARTNVRPRLKRNARGRDLVLADVHGHFATPRRALAKLEVNEHDRVFSFGNLVVVDGGPRSVDALDGLALNGDAPEKLTERLSRLAPCAAYGSATGTGRTQAEPGKRGASTSH